MQKIVSYAGTGVMLVAISVMVPNVERPDYLPLFLLQAAFVLVSAVVYGLLVKEPALVQKMHQKSLEMGIREDEVEKDDSPEASGKERVADRSMRLSIAMLLAATFFYNMSYNAMTTNISRYADIFYGMAGGSYAIINIVTIVGALAIYVPLANLSLKVAARRSRWPAPSSWCRARWCCGWCRVFLPCCTWSSCSWASPWPALSKATPSSLTRSSAARRRPRPSRAGAAALAAGGRGSGQRT